MSKNKSSWPSLKKIQKEGHLRKRRFPSMFEKNKNILSEILSDTDTEIESASDEEKNEAIQTAIDTKHVFAKKDFNIQNFLKKENTLLDLSNQNLCLYKSEEINKQLEALEETLKKITHIDLSYATLPKWFFFHCINSMERMSNLTSLNLRSTDLSGFRSQCLESDTIFNRLTSLDLSNTSIYPRFIPFLTKKLKENSSLCFLDVSHNDYLDKYEEEIIESLAHNTSLTHFRYNHSKSGDALSSQLKDILKNRNLILQDVEMNSKYGKDHFRNNIYLEGNKAASIFFSSPNYTIECIKDNEDNIQKINDARKLGIENFSQKMIDFIRSSQTNFITYIASFSVSNKNKENNTPLNENEISIRNKLLEKLQAICDEAKKHNSFVGKLSEEELSSKFSSLHTDKLKNPKTTNSKHVHFSL